MPGHGTEPTRAVLLAAQRTSRTSSFESRVGRRKRESAAYARATARASLGSTASELLGRDVEAARVDAIIDRLPDGGARLVVSGDAGVGKSALLH
jgi:transcriptional regulator with AAA-type ATPase domain